MPRYRPLFSAAHVKDAVRSLLEENMDTGVAAYNEVIDADDDLSGFALKPIKTYSNAPFRK